jgi:hypothetical protein
MDQFQDDGHWPDLPRLWEYTLAGGYRVMAGKTDVDNDRLSLKVAGPNDWWFHVRGMPGSHVVLVVDKDCPPDRRTLNAAAAIAAYHSKARGGWRGGSFRDAGSPCHQTARRQNPAPFKFVKKGFLKSGRRCLKFIEPTAWIGGDHDPR